MRRHYSAKKLKPALYTQLRQAETVLWNQPPYLIAKLSGELTRVMIEAAQQYIYEKTLSELRRGFRHAAFTDENPLYQEFSVNSKKDTT
jgi:hypothetical protein